MAEINKATLTEADIISKYLLPAIKAAGWEGDCAWPGSYA